MLEGKKKILSAQVDEVNGIASADPARVKLPLMSGLVEVRGIPPIRQRADEWMGHPAFVEYTRVHLFAYLAFASKGAQNNSGNHVWGEWGQVSSCC
jgi:hypothetical protein